MSPEVLTNRLAELNKVLLDLSANVALPLEEQKASHYEIERQVQLAVDLSVGVARRILSLEGEEIPSSARLVFKSLVQLEILESALAERLALAAGLRNILVHDYQSLNEELFFSGLEEGFKMFKSFSLAITAYLSKKYSV